MAANATAAMHSDADAAPQRCADAAPPPPKHWPSDEATYTDRNIYDGPPKTLRAV